MKKDLLKKIKNKSVKIGLVGLGYAGLPIALRFAQSGCKVLGIDIDQDKVSILNNKKSPFIHISDDEIKEAISKGFSATSDFSMSRECDVIILCLPTPLDEHNHPDLSFIKNTMLNLKNFFRKGQVLILESTTYPGTTEEILKPYIDELNFELGKDFFLGYSPEREDPGNLKYTTKSIPKVCSGFSIDCLDLIEKIYLLAVDEVVRVSSPATAEMTKLLENIYRSVNIGLVNEMKVISSEMNIDIHEVIDAASTKPFGFTPFYPGPGLGGHCIPVDPFYLSWKAKQVGLESRFIELSGQINQNMPEWIFSKIKKFYVSNNKNFKNLKFLVLGLSYKRNIDDMRESPSLRLLDVIKKAGFEINYSDPFFKNLPKTRKFNFKLRSVDITPSNLKKFDVVVLSTDHDSFDYKMIKEFSNLIVDTRGVYRESSNNILKV